MKVILHVEENDSKYRDIAPLTEKLTNMLSYERRTKFKLHGKNTQSFKLIYALRTCYSNTRPFILDLT